MEKPENVNEYIKWLKKNHDISISNKTKTYYDSVSSKVESTFRASPFWVELTEQLQEFNDQFSLKTQYPLLVNDKIELDIKTWNSFLEKNFRHNVVNNYNWPNPPELGWVFDDTWFSKANDIVRTLINVKYLDGVDYLIKKIESLAEKHDLEITKKLEARDDGYYAAHVYIIDEFDIPKIDWDSYTIKISIEIQITTQLQEVIRTLLHRYYETARKSPRPDDSWKWDYKSNEFSASYLGHILHYIEGLIVQTREKQKI